MKSITRLEVIDEKGRAYVNTNCEIELSEQDEGRTLKVFVKNRKEKKERTHLDLGKLMSVIGIFNK